MAGPIDMGWKKYEKIGCWTHSITLIFDPNPDLELWVEWKTIGDYHKLILLEWNVWCT